MAIQTVANLANSIRTQYIEAYMRGALRRRLYDQLSHPVGRDIEELQHGSSVQINFLLGMDPSTTAISELVDITPQALVDKTASITPTSRGNALRFSELLSIQRFTDYEATAMEKVGDNAMESIEFLAQTAALTGSLVSRVTTRVLLDAGEATHRLSAAAMSRAQAMLETLKCPKLESVDGTNGAWAAIMHPFVYYDLRTTSPIVDVAEYQRAEIVMNEELGKYGPFRIVSSAWAKIFGAAGEVNAATAVSTLDGAVAKGDTQIVTTANLSALIAASPFWTIGTEETANVHDPTSEQIKCISAVTNTIQIVGSGDNGGLRYNHDDLTSVRNKDNVFPVAFGSTASMAKIYATSVGEYGHVSDIETDGTLDQWRQIWWKWYGAYAVLNQNHVIRGEYSSSLDA
jgi:N4-gp56 family major capsid protein